MELQKAWDKDALVADLKAKGLVDAEKLLKDFVGSFLDWTVSSAALEAASQPLFALVPAVVSAVKPAIDAELDKIAP